MKWLFVVGLVVLSAACSGRGDAGPSPSTPADAPTVAASNTADETSSAPAARDQFALGDPITSAEATASIPMERDGRQMFAVAGYGEEILLEANRRVPPAPGEVVGQGPARYDQLFLLWNPTTNSFREAWRNESERNESVYDIDGDWVLSLFYRNSPGSFWILRIRHLETGEVRDIDQEDDLAPGLGSVQLATAIDSGRVVYTRHSGSGMIRKSEVRLFDVAAGTFEVLDSAEYSLEDMENGSAISATSIDGDLVAWSRQGKLGTAIETPIRDTRTGQEGIFSDIKVGQCQLVRGAAWLACDTMAALRGPAGSPIGSAYVRLADDRVFPAAADGVPYFHTWDGWFQLFVGAVGPSRFSIINTESLRVRVLDVTNVASTPRLIDGWFTWIEWTDTPDGLRDYAKSTLRVMRLQ